MNRSELEHLIRAASAITNEYEIMVVGSQSILGAVPNAPSELLMSMEADIYPPNRPELADLIDGAIGEMSPFQKTFGYYGQGVGPETAILPAGWQDRLVKIQNQNTDLKIGYCLHPSDLAASKLAAGRDKDWDFVRTMLQHGIVDQSVLRDRILVLPVCEEHQTKLLRWVSSAKAGKTQGGEKISNQSKPDPEALIDFLKELDKKPSSSDCKPKR